MIVIITAIAIVMMKEKKKDIKGEKCLIYDEAEEDEIKINKR